MKIDVLFTPYGVDKDYFENKTCVIIDILRATTSIANALNNGAEAVIPFDNIEKMFSLRDSSSETPLLAGEKDTLKIEGFDLGNSPFDFSKENVDGRKVLLYTTNGTKAILSAENALDKAVCSFNNLQSTVNFIKNKAEELVILCSGSEGKFSKEDTFCAGFLINRLKNSGAKPELTDSGEAALTLFNYNGENILQVLNDSEHGKKLIANGYEKDIYFASRLDIINRVAKISNNEIRLKFD